MAKSNSVLVYCVILFILILVASEVEYVEVRCLKSKKSLVKVEKIASNVASFKFQKTSPVEVVATSKMESVDDFRPTAPGHSPGAGHSVHN